MTALLLAISLLARRPCREILQRDFNEQWRLYRQREQSAAADH